MYQDSNSYGFGVFTGNTFMSFSDAILQIDCISCIRAILNTRLGIDYLLHSASAANKLVMGEFFVSFLFNLCFLNFFLCSCLTCIKIIWVLVLLFGDETVRLSVHSDGCVQNLNIGDLKKSNTVNVINFKLHDGSRTGWNVRIYNTKL